MPILRALTVAVAAFLVCACQPRQVRIDRANCERLKLGMSREDVVSVMGQPHDENVPEPSGSSLILLYYSTPVLASGPITIWLEKGSRGHRVSRLECIGQM